MKHSQTYIGDFIYLKEQFKHDIKIKGRLYRNIKAVII